MIITIKQNQIEQAITNYVNSKMVIAEGQRLDIDLQATRGPDGYTAVIEVVDADAPQTVSAEVEAPQTTIRETVRAARTEETAKLAPIQKIAAVAPAIAQAESDEEDELVSQIEGEAEPDMEPDMSAEAEPVEPVTKPKSIFARHTKISNAEAADA